MLNYSKKLDRKIFILGLLICTVFLLATTIPTDFATISSINNTTTGGISGALNSSSPGDIIELDEGTYTGNNNTNMTITKNVTIQGKTKDKVILDAQGLSRIYALDNNLNVTFINITFINANCSTFDGEITYGGAIYNSYLNTVLEFINCTFVNNSAPYGGAIAAVGNTTIKDSYFTNNTADFSAPTLYFMHNGPFEVVLNIINSTFNGNSAGASDGGGLYIYSRPHLHYPSSRITVNIINSRFINNSAFHGGGIAIHAGTIGSVTAKIYNSTINDNIALNNGGGIYVCSNVMNNNNVNVTIYDSTINGNTAGYNGGALSSNTGENSTGNSIIIVIDSVIENNNAGNDGGALSSNTGENSTGNSIIVVIDSDIENNTAGNNGDTASATTGDGSSGDSEIDIIGDSTIINSNPDKDDDGIYTSTGENSTGNSEINIDDGVIKKLSSNSTLIVSNTVVGKTVVIRGVAIDENGNPLANIQLTINIDGVDYNVTTNALGEWSLNYTPSSPGIITVTVDLNENNKYYAFTNTTDFNVAKANTRSTIVISNATSGKSTIIRGVLVDENGNTIANAPINLVIGGKSYNLVTGADGSWSLSYTPLKAGNFIAKVYYNGNTNNLASTSSLKYTLAQGTSAPKKTDIRLLKKKSSKVFRHGKRVVMKWFTYKNYGATGSKNITTKVILKNLKYKLWKVYNKKLSYKYGNNKIKFKLNLKSGEKFKLKLKVYKPIK